MTDDSHVQDAYRDWLNGTPRNDIADRILDATVLDHEWSRELTTRARTAIRNLDGAATFRMLVCGMKRDSGFWDSLLYVRNCGDATCEQIRLWLESHGLRLHVTHHDWIAT